MRDTPYLLQIGRLIKETRLKNGTRIREIAEKAKVSKGLISKIENARTVPSLPVLISVITALDINIGDFFSPLIKRFRLRKYVFYLTIRKKFSFFKISFYI